MREILFRGKRVNNGEWAYGDLVKARDKTYIHPNANTFEVKKSSLSNCVVMREVIPETVGQYTGLTDKNGTKIFEGDMVYKNGVIIRKVEWEEESTGFFPFTVIEDGGKSYVGAEECEVIGNIYDNPELLG